MEKYRNFKPEYRNDYVSKVFNTRDEADQAYNDLSGRGYSQDDINVMMSDDTRDRYFSNDRAHDSALADNVADNAGTGSMIGGGIGAVVGAIAAIGSNVFLPGLGLIIAGPLAAGLVGAGAGAATGGLIGALTGMGVSEDEAETYRDHIKDGGIYMGYKPKNEDDARSTYDRWYSNDTYNK